LPEIIQKVNTTDGEKKVNKDKDIDRKIGLNIGIAEINKPGK
jgi:hypothetical protein